MEFDILDMLNNKSLELTDRTNNNFENSFYITPIDIELIDENEKNFYDTSDIEELKQSIKAVGLQQNIVVSGNEDYGYKIISGHRRYKAFKELVENKEINLHQIPCRVVSVTKLEEELILILSNSNTRVLSPYEKMEQVKRLKEIATEIKKSNNNFIKGSVRDYISNMLDMSKSEVGRYEVIDKNLNDELKEDFKQNNINSSVAYEIAKLPKEKQQEAKEIIESKEKVSIKDIKNIKAEKIDGVQLVVDNNEIVEYEEPNKDELDETEDVLFKAIKTIELLEKHIKQADATETELYRFAIDIIKENYPNATTDKEWEDITY